MDPRLIPLPGKFSGAWVALHTKECWIVSDENGTAEALPQGQFHRGDLLGVRSAPLPARDGGEALTWFSIMLAVDGVEVAIGTASEKAVKAALTGCVVGESVELPTYAKLTSKGQLSVRLAGAASGDSGRGDWVPAWSGAGS
jgi:hypothetical protein